jgi:hypothetical protein
VKRLPFEAVHVALAAPTASKLVRLPAGSAAPAAAALVSGGRVSGLTMGQFSLLDLIRALLIKTGPADVTISTWTAGIRDAETAAWLLTEERIRSLRFVVDRSFPTRQPRYARRMLELFGPSAIVCTRTHAKFATIVNDDWKLAIRSSMNLNENTRIEQYDVDDSPEMTAMYSDFVDLMASATGAGIEPVEDLIQAGLATMPSDAGEREAWEEFVPRRANQQVVTPVVPKPAPRSFAGLDLSKLAGDL